MVFNFEIGQQKLFLCDSAAYKPRKIGVFCLFSSILPWKTITWRWRAHNRCCFWHVVEFWFKSLILPGDNHEWLYMRLSSSNLKLFCTSTFPLWGRALTKLGCPHHENIFQVWAILQPRDLIVFPLQYSLFFELCITSSIILAGWGAFFGSNSNHHTFLAFLLRYVCKWCRTNVCGKLFVFWFIIFRLSDCADRLKAYRQRLLSDSTFNVLTAQISGSV